MRLFLAMLALVAGLAATPAQARMTPADVSELERVETRSPNGSAIAAATAEVQSQSKGERRERTRVRRPATVIILIPSIQYGDRSLE